jgi:hypothetical protein
MGSAEEVRTIFDRGLRGLEMVPLSRVPPTLPTGFVYFDIVRHPTYWKDVVRTHTLGFRFRVKGLEPGQPGAVAIGDQIIRVYDATGRTYDLQFAVFVVKER